MSTPYYSPERGGYLPLPPGVPSRYTDALPAFATYTRRQLRQESPDGRQGDGGRWQPSDTEWQACCASVRKPSRRWPYSLLVHCSTAGHVAAMHQVAPSLLRGLIAWVVRYYGTAPTAPDLCQVCGVDFACEHRPDLNTAGMRVIPDHRADMDRHLGPSDPTRQHHRNDWRRAA